MIPIFIFFTLSVLVILFLMFLAWRKPLYNLHQVIVNNPRYSPDEKWLIYVSLPTILIFEIMALAFAISIGGYPLLERIAVLFIASVVLVFCGFAVIQMVMMILKVLHKVNEPNIIKLYHLNLAERSKVTPE